MARVGTEKQGRNPGIRLEWELKSRGNMARVGTKKQGRNLGIRLEWEPKSRGGTREQSYNIIA